jgi:YjbE family integral membrane protein
VRRERSGVTVGSIAQFLHLGLWRDVLQSSVSDVGRTAFWIAALQIILINILLSGDNAVVIAMACRGLPQRQRYWGLAVGAGFAVTLRIIFTVIIAELMQFPYLKLFGGLALLYIAARLLLPGKADKNEVDAAANLWGAVWIIVVADVVMSFDNVIAIAAAAQGDLVLLAIGLAFSIPLILAGAALVMTLLDRFPILVWAGSALLGWVAGGVIATDPSISNRVTAAFGEEYAQQIALAAAVAGAALVIAVGGLWRRLRLSNLRSHMPGE